MYSERYVRGARYDLSSLNLLVVEDNPNMQRLLQAILRAIGVCDISLADSGEEALENMKSYEADIVITDWRMQPMDGLELARTLRLSPDSPNPYVPIIMVTGQTEMGRVMEARDAGVNYVLAKPVSAKSLADRITALIDDPAPFVRTKDYFGPDRRHRSMQLPEGFVDRRVTTPPEDEEKGLAGPWRDSWARSS